MTRPRPPFGLLAIVLWGAAWVLLPGCSSDDPVETWGPTPLAIENPSGWPSSIWSVLVPPDNPTTVEGVELGRLLFYDPILSGDSTQACSDCHLQANAFSDPRQFSIGIDGIAGDRNAPPIFNVGWFENFFWDGREPQLEDQALQPVPNPIEMHLEWDVAEDRLNRHPDYPPLFDFVFGPGPVTRGKVVKAIAQFERTMISANATYDKWIRGEAQLSPSAQRGRALFLSEDAECFHCHGAPFFTSHEFANNGVDSVIIDIGLEGVTGLVADRGKFRIPSLRNLTFTAPYMHDGRFETLEEVLEFYSSGVNFHPNLANELLPEGQQFMFSAGEKADLIEFLKTLDDYTFISNPDFSNPFE